jgi:uncharacterized membrane-anchored protein
MLQTGLILSVPTQAAYTNLTGREVILQTVASSPENVLQGYALNLDYNIARVSNLRRLPGWNNIVRNNRGRNGRLLSGTNIYVILREQQSFGRGVPRAWRPVRVTNTLPISLPNNQVALRGVYENGAVNYGVETFNVADEQRQLISEDIRRSARQNRTRQLRPITVKVKVDPQGNAVPVSLWVRDRNYSF